jgi:hypothetical protein
MHQRTTFFTLCYNPIRLQFMEIMYCTVRISKEDNDVFAIVRIVAKSGVVGK